MTDYHVNIQVTDKLNFYAINLNQQNWRRTRAIGICTYESAFGSEKWTHLPTMDPSPAHSEPDHSIHQTPCVYPWRCDKENNGNVRWVKTSTRNCEQVLKKPCRSLHRDDGPNTIGIIQFYGLPQRRPNYIQSHKGWSACRMGIKFAPPVIKGMNGHTLLFTITFFTALIPSIHLHYRTHCLRCLLLHLLLFCFSPKVGSIFSQRKWWFTERLRYAEQNLY